MAIKNNNNKISKIVAWGFIHVSGGVLSVVQVNWKQDF
jgi:hypothetical protein